MLTGELLLFVNLLFTILSFFRVKKLKKISEAY